MYVALVIRVLYLIRWSGMEPQYTKLGVVLARCDCVRWCLSLVDEIGKENLHKEREGGR